MATIFRWTVDAMDCHVQLNDKTDVVYNVHWRCTAFDGDVSASVYGSCIVPEPTAMFIPYENLTENQVLDWILGTVINKDETETMVNNQLNAILHPVSIRHNLPWA